jgi:hypothetical protein
MPSSKSDVFELPQSPVNCRTVARSLFAFSVIGGTRSGRARFSLALSTMTMLHVGMLRLFVLRRYRLARQSPALATCKESLKPGE